MMRDAADWKKRALAAEAKLHGYRRLREIGEEILKAALEESQGGPSINTDELRDELVTLDIVEPPRNFYNQDIDLDGARLVVREKTGMIGCADLDYQNGVVEINASQPDEGKAIGLLFHLAQLADVACGMVLGSGQALNAERLHQFSPALLSLLAVTGLLNPAMGITPDGVERFVSEHEPDSAASGGTG
jgi:hypothetical protein